MKINVESLLQEWSEKFSSDLNELRSKLEELKKEERRLHKKLTKEAQEKNALQRLYNQLQQQSLGKVYSGVVIGDTGLIDWIQRRKDRAIRLFKRNPDEAITSGLTNSKGIPLDNRETLFDGQENPNFGKPLTGEQLERTLFIAKDKELFAVFVLGELARDLEVPLFKQVEFVAKKSKRTIDAVALQLPSASIDVLSDVDVAKVLSNFHKPLKEVFKLSDATLCSTEGSVVAITSDERRRRMILSDLDAEESLTCLLSPTINVYFGEDSRILVFGKVIRPRERTFFEAYGVYALPEYLTKPTVDVGKKLDEENFDVQTSKRKKASKKKTVEALTDEELEDWLKE